jgi:hypothetical protein
MLGHAYFNVKRAGMRCMLARDSDSPIWMKGIRLQFNKTSEGRLRGFQVNSSMLRRLLADLDDTKRKLLEEKLENTLRLVLRIHPRLHYVQVYSTTRAN